MWWIITYPSLEDVSLCGSITIQAYLSLCIPNGFGGRAGSQLSTSSPWVLASITLVKGRGGNWGAKARAKCEFGLLLCSVAITILLVAGSGPKCSGRNPEGQIWACSSPSKYVYSPLLDIVPSLQRGVGMQKEGLEQAAGATRACTGMAPACQSDLQTAPDPLPSVSASNKRPCHI